MVGNMPDHRTIWSIMPPSIKQRAGTPSTFYKASLKMFDEQFNVKTLGPKDDGVAEWNQMIIESLWYASGCKQIAANIDYREIDLSEMQCEDVTCKNPLAITFSPCGLFLATDELGNTTELKSCLSSVNEEPDHDHSGLIHKVLTMYFDYGEPGGVMTYRRIPLVSGWTVQDTLNDLPFHPESFEFGHQIDRSGLELAAKVVIGHCKEGDND